MAAPKKKMELPPKQSPEYLRGVFAALEAMRLHGGDAGTLQNSECEAVGKALGVPALFVEAAMSYEHADVVALGEWWQALKGGA
jgi:hypothetical protein